MSASGNDDIGPDGYFVNLGEHLVQGTVTFAASLGGLNKIGQRSDGVMWTEKRRARLQTATPTRRDRGERRERGGESWSKMSRRESSHLFQGMDDVCTHCVWIVVLVRRVHRLRFV